MVDNEGREAEIQARRAARKAELKKGEQAQRVIDLEALDSAEVEHGDSNVAYLDVPYTPGMPTMVIIRCPKPSEVKRYQDRVKPKANGKQSPDAAMDAARELGAATLLYPPKELFTELLEQRPGLDMQAGVESLGLARATSADEGKD